MDAAKKPKKSYAKTARKGAGWSILRQSGHELIGLPTSMIMARLLTPTDFGIAAASSFFIVLAARLTQFGFNAALVRVKDLRPEHESSVFVVSLAAGLFNYLVLFFAAPFIGDFFRSADAGHLVRFAALSFLVAPFSTVPTSLMSRGMQFRYLAYSDWTDSIVGTCITLTLAFNGFGFWSIPYGHISGILVRVVLQHYLTGWRPSLRVSRAALQELLSYGLGIQTKRLLQYATQNIDNMVVGRVLGVGQLGIYDKAFMTMNRMVTRLTLGQAPFRIFAIIHEDVERFGRAYSRLILSITLVAFPIMAGCIVAAKPLFEVLYGQQWGAAVLPFQLLCVGGMLKLLDAYASQAIEAAGNVWAQARRQLVGAVLVTVGAGAGSYYGGLTGAAFGVLLAMAILSVIMQDLVRRATGLSWRALLRPQLPAAFTTVVVIGVLLATEAVLTSLSPGIPAWQLLGAEVLVGGLVYTALVVFSPFNVVREVVRETAQDVLPGPALQVFNRLTAMGQA
jgi:O-antigen/teichoic acid export membrane protein